MVLSYNKLDLSHNRLDLSYNRTSKQNTVRFVSVPFTPAPGSAVKWFEAVRSGLCVVVTQVRKGYKTVRKNFQAL